MTARNLLPTIVTDPENGKILTMIGAHNTETSKVRSQPDGITEMVTSQMNYEEGD